jgi:hypothetical protein
VRPGGASDGAALPSPPNAWAACFAGEHDDGTARDQSHDGQSEKGGSWVGLSTSGSDARRLGRLKGGNEAGEVRRFP